MRFALASARRVVVVVRGPLPSCNRAARFAVRGHRGANAVRFDGTVGARRLSAGSYLVGIMPASSSTVLWAALHLGPRGAQPLPRRIVRPALGQCSSATAARALLVARLDSGTAGSTIGTAPPSSQVRPAQQVDRVPTPEAAVLPFSGIEQAASDLPAALGYLLLGLLGASLFGLGLFVVRFIRSPAG